MFEGRSKQQKIALFAIISLIFTLMLSFYHAFLLGWDIYVVIVAGNIEFFCLFYILYLPTKLKEKKD